MHDLTPGQTLGGRYLLAEVVGSGGVADVHRATDLLLQRTVAVKVLHDRSGSENDAIRFAAEVRTLAGLNHRGLVTVLDAGTTAGRAFLVMELVDGPTLHVLLAQGPLGSERTADLGAQLADALAYVHGRGVLHRDVKPGNVLVGRGDRARLADFGIARIVGDAAHHTRTGQTIGTAAYLAPEQVLGTDLTAAVDVYALGLVLLEALTGQRAFAGPPTEAALARLTRSPAIPLSLHPAWTDLLAAMTAHDPAERPSAADVAVELRDLRDLDTSSGPTAWTTDDPGDRTVAMAPPTRWRVPSAGRAPAAPAPVAPAPVAPSAPAAGVVGRLPTAGPVLLRRTLAAVTAAALLVLAVVLTTTALRPGTGSTEPAVGDTAPTEPAAPSDAVDPVGTVSSASPSQPAAAATAEPVSAPSSASTPGATRSGQSTGSGSREKAAQPPAKKPKKAKKAKPRAPKPGGPGGRGPGGKHGRGGPLR